MRAPVLSGGGTKEAFAGRVAEHLIQLQNEKYDLFFCIIDHKFHLQSLGLQT